LEKRRHRRPIFNHNLRFERSLYGPTLYGTLPTFMRGADIRASARQLARRIDQHMSITQANDPHQVPFGFDLSATNTSSLWLAPRLFLDSRHHRPLC